MCELYFEFQLRARMNGIHEVTGSIPVWSTNLRSRVRRRLPTIARSAKVGPLPVATSYGWQATLRANGLEVHLGSIVRTEAVRPFPVPEREIIIMRDIDTGLEPGELPSPARERAHSEAE